MHLTFDGLLHSGHPGNGWQLVPHHLQAGGRARFWLRTGVLLAAGGPGREDSGTSSTLCFTVCSCL